MKKLFAVLFAVVMTFTFAGCAGGTQAAQKEVQVGIVLPTRDEPRWAQDEASFTSILGSAGFTSEVLFSQGSSATELTNVESLIQKGIKVLVISAQDAAAAAQAAEKAKEAGITVVCYDRLITGTDAVDYYVTFNNFDTGVKQGQFLIDRYAGKTGVPLYLYAGATADNNAYVFFSGAWSVLGKAVADGQFTVVNCPAITEYIGRELDANEDREALSSIMGTVTTDWDFNKAKSLAEANLVANDASEKGDVAILAPNDGMARAIADAFCADDDVTSYQITGQDSEIASLSYICAGKQSMTIWKDTSSLAAATCDIANAVLSGSTPATNVTVNNGVKDIPASETPVTVVTIDNIDVPVKAGRVKAEDIDGYPGK